MSFEEEFPEICVFDLRTGKDKPENTTEDLRFFGCRADDMQEFCLSKQRVREAIEKIPDTITMTQNTTEQDKYLLNLSFIKTQLKKELGL